MQITFRGSPELLKIDEIGEYILGTDDSLSRQVISVVLAAIRNGGIPLRTKNGFKVSTDGLESVKRHARLTATHDTEHAAGIAVDDGFLSRYGQPTLNTIFSEACKDRVFIDWKKNFVKIGKAGHRRSFEVIT